ncbi:hypothetical protein EDD17DRAFT_726406 [Pisolithus thermaeus]|nr:hypothetical protein EDD17DRAFT_726406 [Pisolithus thermaeus]
MYCVPFQVFLYVLVLWRASHRLSSTCLAFVCCKQIVGGLMRASSSHSKAVGTSCRHLESSTACHNFISGEVHGRSIRSRCLRMALPYIFGMGSVSRLSPLKCSLIVMRTAFLFMSQQLCPRVRG